MSRFAPCHPACARLLLLASLMFHWPALAQSPSPPTSPIPITRATDVRQLTVEQATEQRAVRLEARVTFISSPGTVFIQDADAGTFVRTKQDIDSLQIGDLIQVEGVTFPGLYLTGIASESLRVLEHGPPPAAQNVTYDDLTSGRYHYQLVKIQGVVRRLTPSEENLTLLTLALGQQQIEVRVDAPPTGQDWVDTLVEVHGLAAGGINDRRQLVHPYLRVADWRQITPLSLPTPPAAIPEISALNLLRFRPTPDQGIHLRRVRLHGQVLACLPAGKLFLRDLSHEPPTAYAAVLGQPAPDCQPGDHIELIGFPEMGGFSARLRDAQILSSTPDSAPEPRATQIPHLAATDLDAELVRLQARVVEQWRTADGTTFQLRDGSHTLPAFLPGTHDITLLPGTQIVVTGICELESTIEGDFRAAPTAARLHLRGPGDIQILKSPSWWTTRRLLTLVAVLATLILASTVWISLLRRQVLRQSLTLRTRIAHEAMLEERQRIAREFHDTLEQELAGLSIRLGAVGSRPLDEKAKSLLDTSLRLVARVQSEARNLVADLRIPDDSTTDLPGALRDLIARQPADGPRLELDAPAALPHLPAHITHHLRMIAQEALTNALKHAHASLIRFTLRLDSDTLLLSIHDNGKGFDQPDAPPQAGHFGRVGILERCRKIHASVSWNTAPGQGTEVCVRCPLTPALPQP